MEKMEFTKEQIEKIAEGISVICFRSNSEAKKFVLLEYPKPKDVFGNSCIWDKPIFNKEHHKEVKSVLPSFEAVHTFGSPNLFKPSLAEVIQACPINLLGNFNAVTIHYNGFIDDASKHKSIVLWFDVGIKRYTTSPLEGRGGEALWFDVGIKRYTTVDKNGKVVKSCGLM